MSIMEPEPTGRSGRVGYVEHVSEAPLTGGKLLFRTERFQPPQLGAMDLVTLDGHQPAELELAFQLLNASDHLITLASLQVAQMGEIVIWEDSLPKSSHAVAALQAEAMRMSVGNGVTDLGQLLFHLGETDEGKTLTTGHLLPAEHVEVLQPRTTRSYRLRIRCGIGGRQVSTDLIVTPDLGVIPFRQVARLGTFIIGPSAEPDESMALEDLDREPPEPAEVCHAFVVLVDMLAETGERCRLFSDWIYAVFPAIRQEWIRLRRSDDDKFLPLNKWLALPPEGFTRHVTNWSVKSYRETLAYRIACQSGELRADFDPDEVSSDCYHRDGQSSLRPSPPEPTETGSERMRAYYRRPPWPRSNIVETMARVRDEFPALWQMMAEEIQRMEQGRDRPLSRKASFLRRRLGDTGGHGQ